LGLVLGVSGALQVPQHGPQRYRKGPEGTLELCFAFTKTPPMGNKIKAQLCLDLGKDFGTQDPGQDRSFWIQGFPMGWAPWAHGPMFP